MHPRINLGSEKKQRNQTNVEENAREKVSLEKLIAAAKMELEETPGKVGAAVGQHEEAAAASTLCDGAEDEDLDDESQVAPVDPYLCTVLHCPREEEGKRERSCADLE
jgi:hypothetical protein